MPDQDERIAEGDAALDAGEPERALGLADRVLAERGAYGPALKLRANALEALGDLDAALSAWTDARAALPNSSAVRVDLGNVLFMLGRFQDALAEHEAAVEMEPLQLEGWKGILALRPVSPDEDGLDRVARSIDDPSRSARMRAKAGFVLGQILFEAAEYDDAFRHYVQANATMAEAAGTESLEYRFPTGSFGIDAAFIARHSRLVPHIPACPAIVIAGLPRSGKSLAESLVTTDPTIRAGDVIAVLARHARGYDWSQGPEPIAQVLSRMDVSPLAPQYIAQLQGHRRVTDTAPTNLFRLGLLGLLHPEVPVILCRRDPLDLGAAMFFKQFRRGSLFTTSLPTLGRALARSERLMVHWARNLPNPVMETRYEDMVSDPAAASRSVAALCGSKPATDIVVAKDTRLSAGRSLGFGQVNRSLVGFAKPLQQHFAPMLESYEAELVRLRKTRP